MNDLSNNIITQPKDDENMLNDNLTKNNVGVKIKPETFGNYVLINICGCVIIYS